MFLRYAAIGLLNTTAHWSVFFTLHLLFLLHQSIANFIGFLFAVTLSFFLNAKYTFESKATSLRYILYTSFLGFLAFIFGAIADIYHINGILTVVAFSSCSLISGFLFAKYLVFKKG